MCFWQERHLTYRANASFMASGTNILRQKILRLLLIKMLPFSEHIAQYFHSSILNPACSFLKNQISEQDDNDIIYLFLASVLKTGGWQVIWNISADINLQSHFFKFYENFDILIISKHRLMVNLTSYKSWQLK